MHLPCLHLGPSRLYTLSLQLPANTMDSGCEKGIPDVPQNSTVLISRLVLLGGQYETSFEDLHQEKGSLHSLRGHDGMKSIIEAFAVVVSLRRNIRNFMEDGKGRISSS